ncbi:hypothetical protein ACFX5Q_32720 [Mesorhizobium sp. IMUNJ 23033]|uniref:hypothetical protein n=1 Tax=Mesorhizobium sp. IMUNJ 23033 TaxID=3378039 RepID=UPI0038517DEC
MKVVLKVGYPIVAVLILFELSAAVQQHSTKDIEILRRKIERDLATRTFRYAKSAVVVPDDRPYLG